MKRATKSPRRTKGAAAAGVVPLWFECAALCQDAAQVIAMRSWMIASHDRKAASESERMVTEKLDALFDIGMSLALGKWGMDPVGQARGATGQLRKKVQANRRRLSGQTGA